MTGIPAAVAIVAVLLGYLGLMAWIAYAHARWGGDRFEAYPRGGPKPVDKAIPTGTADAEDRSMT